MEQKIVVDRIEGRSAVLEVAGTTVDWPLSALPDGVREGSTLSVVFSFTEADLSSATARLERLKKRGPTGDDIDL
jgi:hypothetical protein